MKTFKRLFIFLYILLVPSITVSGENNSLIDLEDMSQDFVLEIKKLNIPCFPNAFNPCILRWNDSYLLTFRNIPDRNANFNSWLYIIRLDKDFNPIGIPQELNTRQQTSKIPSRAEDGRLIEVGGRIFFVYSDNIDPKITKGGFRLFIANLESDGEKFWLQNIERLSHFEGENHLVREKNWVPFDYKGNLMLAYSLDPHLIFRPILGTSSCETFSLTKPNIDWDWGELRGGTQGLIVEDQYLSFFHSQKPMSTLHSDGKSILTYFMGAYTFSTEPPFEITQISPEPIVTKGLYKGPYYKHFWHPVRVVFPVGYIYDESYIWVSYGRQDHEAWIAKIDKDKLLKSLVPVRKKG